MVKLFQDMDSGFRIRKIFARQNFSYISVQYFPLRVNTIEKAIRLVRIKTSTEPLLILRFCSYSTIIANTLSGERYI